MVELARPYLALFATQFQLMLQYRAAAFAGFVTQAWWGTIKVMVLVAFYASTGASDAPMTLAQAISYTWLAQAFLALQPWYSDPEVASAVSSGAVGYERARPIDLYAWWFVRAAATSSSRATPRAALMFAAAAVLLPLIGLGEWSLKPPAGIGYLSAFLVSLVLAVLLAAAFQMLLNIVIVASMTDRGVNAFGPSLVPLLAGAVVPLPLLPDWLHPFLFAQPLAGIVDTPLRIYSGDLSGPALAASIALQAFWIAALVLLGRRLLARTIRKLKVQGG